MLILSRDINDIGPFPGRGPTLDGHRPAIAAVDRLVTRTRIQRPSPVSRVVWRSAPSISRALGIPAAIALALALASPAAAAIRRVPTDHATVRAAVDAAANTDTILIAPGTHAGGVYVRGKAVTLASWYIFTGDTATISQTVIDSIVGDPCSGYSSCVGNAVLEFAADAAGSAVIGLTLTRGVDGVRAYAPVDIAWCRVIGNADGIDYQDGAGGVIRNSLFAYNSDDGIDLNGRLTMTVRDNIIRDNHQDGVEFRLYAYAGPVLTIDFIGNRFTGNGGDGIQLIDYPDASDRVIRIERNLFSGNGDAAVGCMPNGQTSEDFSGAPIAERVYLLHNTFTGERYGFVGGANVIALNNIFTGVQMSALRRVGGSSITSYSLFWNNGIHHEESTLDLPNLSYANPSLDPAGAPLAGSPAIDAGTAFFQWQGATVLNVQPSVYRGTAPDMGAYEFDTGGPPAANTAPFVDAGLAQTVTLPADAVLDGTVNDDGLPIPPGAVTTAWTVENGPGPVTFLSGSAIDTRATFTVPGTYLLRLTGNDGALSAGDLVQITMQAASGAVVDRRIAAGSDDAEEASGGKVSVTGSDLELVYDRSNQTVGLRFTNLAIPRGASITRAYVQFEADEAQSVATHLVVQGQAADSPAAFTTATGSISTRPRTVAAVGWSPPAWTPVGAAGDAQRTSDLSTVVQEIVNRPGWASGNALVLIVTGTGHRTAESFEGRAAGAALLHVETGPSGPPPPPPGTNTAPVVSAGPAQTVTLPAEALLDGTVGDDGLPVPPGAVTVTWSVVSGPGTVIFLNASAVDTRATFSTAGIYLLRLTASDGALDASATIEVTVLATSASLERRIAAGSDDAEESASGTMDLVSSDLELVFDGSNQTTGLRFTNVTVPPGALIARAWVQFQADEAQSELTTLTLRGQAADHPAGFTTAAGNIAARPRTAASVSWSPPTWAVVGEAAAAQRTPELASVIQEIVNRPGWVSGNSLVILISGTGRRTAESYEGLASGAALLHLEMGTAASPAEAAAASSAAGTPRAVLTLHRASLDPGPGALRVEFTLADGAPATLELMDVTGRRVATHEVGALGAGRHAIAMRQRLPAGVYLVRLSQASVARVMKAVVLR